MLSYKLRHLCSRIIASLSAFGLFSISDANADVLSGTIAEYSYTTSPITFSANYDYSVTCNTNGMENINGELVLNEDGSVSGCKFMCTSGYAVDMLADSAINWTVGYDVIFDGSANTLYASSGCVARGVEFRIHDNLVYDLVFDEFEGTASHDMNNVYAFYGSNDVSFNMGKVNGYLTEGEDYGIGDKNVFLKAEVLLSGYFENPEFAGYEFKGLMDENGNLVMDENLDPLVDNFDHLIEGKFGANVFKSSGIYEQFIIEEDNAPKLYAKWEPRTMSTAFDCGGSGIITGDAPSSVVYGDSLSLPTCVPSQSGLVFKGWAVSNEAEGIITDFVVK